jgi:hypothetical protein
MSSPVNNSDVTVTMPVNLRWGGPTTASPIAAQLVPGSIVIVTGTVQGYEIAGNTTWYRGLGDLYIWSGACAPR